MSWVDGQVVTDWAAEIAKRERAIDGYLNDADPGRAAKYGFRSGQNPRLAWSWFRDNPVGFNGVPFVLFKTILDLDPERRRSDAASDRADLEARGDRARSAPGASATAGRSIISASARRRPTTSTASRVRPASAVAVPFGFAFENPRTFEPLSTGRTPRDDARCWPKRVFQNTSLLLAKLKTVDHEDNWEKDRPGFGTRARWIACSSRARRATSAAWSWAGKMKFLPGMPNTEIEAQYYSKLLMLTGAALVESGFDPSSPTPVNPDRRSSRIRDAVQALYTAMLDKALKPSRDDVRIVAGADRARQDSDAGGCRRVPERDARI